MTLQIWSILRSESHVHWLRNFALNTFFPKQEITAKYMLPYNLKQAKNTVKSTLRF